MRNWYRLVLAFMVLLVVIAAVESGRWLLLFILLSFGFTVWRSEFPSWNHLWLRLNSSDETLPYAGWGERTEKGTE
jgi:hypothetical protein